MWHEIDLSKNKNAFTAKELLDAVIKDANLNLMPDSESYNHLLDTLTKQGPINQQLVRLAGALALNDMINRHTKHR